MIQFTVLMPPGAKARARTVVHNGKVRTFTPSKTVDAESMIRLAYFNESKDRINKPNGVQLSCAFTITKPKSAPKKREILPITRPDIDNYIKLVLDALNGYAWEDDSQIIILSAVKRYGDISQIEITISTLTT
jgi:Holliday junction resolvase RusA-like endonuclease